MQEVNIAYCPLPIVLCLLPIADYFLLPILVFINYAVALYYYII